MFGKDYTGFMKFKEVLTSTEWRTVSLLQGAIGIGDMKSRTSTDVMGSSFALPLVSLASVA